MTKLRLVVFSGSGISAESGIRTFRDSGGLWEEHRIEDVATPEAFARNPKLVLDFYNQRRKQMLAAEPNEAHKALVRLEEKYDVTVVTQNVDDLHERAGSTKVIHLHGELRKARSTKNPSIITTIEGWELSPGHLGPDGAQLRPHIVWFGEMVPELDRAALVVARADLFIVTGTSLNVYPAAGLVHAVQPGIPCFLVDPAAESLSSMGFELIAEKAGTGIPRLVERLLDKA